ncbi:MAG: hypothetical protein EPO26_05785 [Chloroflexota bacterium]|nr:MAG: hypothetical protein EPO26_05785 [Chloroflexota bacterium]
MSDETNRAQGTPNAVGPPEVEIGSALQAADVERDWTTRRLEIYRQLDGAVQQAVANVLQAAAETRQAMEAEAKLVLDRLRHERSRLIEDIRDYRRQRDGLSNEIGEARRRAEEEAARIRRAAETEKTAMLRDSETRKVELTAEIQRLEQQLADVSSGIQSLLQEQIGRVRGDVGQSSRRAPPIERTPPRAAPPAPAPSAAAAYGASAQVSPPAPVTAPVAAEPPAPPRDGGTDVTLPPVSPIAEPSIPPVRARPSLPPVVPPRRQVTPPPVATPSVLPEEPVTRPAPVVVAVPARPAAIEPAGVPGKIEVAVTNTPSFARALEFQRGVQRTEGVKQVQALQFERGTLVLAVDYEPEVDLVAAIERLPNLGVTMTGETATRLEFTFPLPA